MPRTAAKLNQADIARAIRAADACGKSVRLLPNGTIEIVEKAGPVTETVDRKPKVRL